MYKWYNIKYYVLYTFYDKYYINMSIFVSFQNYLNYCQVTYYVFVCISFCKTSQSFFKSVGILTKLFLCKVLLIVKFYFNGWELHRFLWDLYRRAFTGQYSGLTGCINWSLWKTFCLVNKVKALYFKVEFKISELGPVCASTG